MTVERNDLVETLKLLIKHMEEKGLLHGIKDKENLIQQVAQHILSVRPDITKAELLDPKFQKSLAVSIMSQHISNNTPGFKFDYTKLFKFNKHDLLDPKTREAEEKELKNVFKMLLTQLNKLTPESKRKSEKELDAIAGMMAKKGLDTYLKQSDQFSMQQSNTMLNLLMEPLAELSSRQLFGGINPKMAGSIVYPVQAILGNLFGIADQVGGNENSTAFIDELYRADPGKSDPLGIENKNIERLGDLGVFTATLRTVLGGGAPEPEPTVSKSPTPLDTRYTPPGTKT